MLLIALAMIVATLCACSSWAKSDATALRQRTLLDGDWLFRPGEVSTNEPVVSLDYDDHQWRHVQVPHDYLLDGIYDPTNGRQNGFLPKDVAWYRKRFLIPR